MQYSIPTNTGLCEQSNQVLQSMMIKSCYIARAMFKQNPQFTGVLGGGEEGEGHKNYAFD